MLSTQYPANLEGHGDMPWCHGWSTRIASVKQWVIKLSSNKLLYLGICYLLTNETMWASSPVHHAPQDSIENSRGFKCIRIPQQNFGVKMKSGTDLKGRRSWYSRAPVLLQKGFDKSWGAVSMVTKRKPREGRRLLENLGGRLFAVFSVQPDLTGICWDHFSKMCVLRASNGGLSLLFGPTSPWSL